MNALLSAIFKFCIFSNTFENGKLKAKKEWKGKRRKIWVCSKRIWGKHFEKV